MGSPNNDTVTMILQLIIVTIIKFFSEQCLYIIIWEAQGNGAVFYDDLLSFILPAFECGYVNAQDHAVSWSLGSHVYSTAIPQTENNMHRNGLVSVCYNDG